MLSLSGDDLMDPISGFSLKGLSSPVPDWYDMIQYKTIIQQQWTDNIYQQMEHKQTEKCNKQNVH